MTVDPRAASGFGAAAAAYDRGRPSYPPEAVARLARRFGLGPESPVLDLAAGTGKLTSALPGRVIAVEPTAAMLEVLRARLPEVDARAGTAEAIPVEDASVEAVFVGEAFHWFRTREACAEIARVLVPGGGLALLWNRAEWDDLPWHAAFVALSQPYREAAGAFPADDWRDELDATGRFAPRQEADVEMVHRTDLEGFVALVSSWSWIAGLPAGERAAFLGRVRELVADAPDLVPCGPVRRAAPRDAELRLRYRTEIHWTRSV